MTTGQPDAAPRLHYAWVVALVTFVVLLITAGVRATPGLFMVPLESEFGWSRATISVAIAVNIALFGLIGPFAASVMNRWGLRRVVLAALALLTASVAVSTRMHTEWQLLLLWGVLVGAGTGVTSMVLAAVVATRWFDQRRGVVLGALSAANATGQLVFLPMLAGVVETSGWRTAALLVAAAAAVVFVIVFLFMRDRPGDVGLRPYGQAPDAEPAPGPPPMAPLAALGFAARTQAFWVLAGTFFVCGASTNGLIGTHLISACHDVGIPAMRSAQLLALMGIFDILGTTASGWLTDRYSARHLLFGYYTLRGLSLLFLPATLLDRRRRARPLRGVLRPRLDCDGAADGEADHRGVRTGEHRRGLRLDRRQPPARRVDGGVRRRRHPHRAGRLPARVPDGRRPVSRRRGVVPRRRPAHAAGRPGHRRRGRLNDPVRATTEA